ncbi:MAG: hypothetical protein FJX35_04690 [Alphaproteobacteria bacterium]|nr:hypothetical protein [Alphaproteobacteria bacterium]
MMNVATPPRAEILECGRAMPDWDCDEAYFMRVQAQSAVVRMMIEIWLREVQIRVRTERRIQKLRQTGRY